MSLRLSLPASAAFATLCAAPVLAQNSFRPLPEIPALGEWSGGASPSPAARARSLFEELEAAASEPREETFFEGRVFADVVAGSNLSGGGNLSTQHGGWSATFGRELDDERLAALSLSTEAFFYNFGGATKLVPGASNPFNDLYEARISALVRTRDDDVPGWFGGMSLQLGGEDEAEAREALTVGGVGGVRWAKSRDFEVEVGVAALSRLEDDPWIWPFLGFHWNASERLSFEARGTSVEARWAFDDAWSAFTRAEYTLHQFRLNEDNPLPNGVLRDSDIRLGVGIERRSKDGIAFELFGGLDVWRELSTLDENGTKVAEVEADPAPFVAASLRLSL